MALSVCTSCQRHVKGDGACPFCGGAISAGPSRVAASRVSRAAMLFGAAAVTAVTAACTSGVALYGAPAPEVDSGTEDGGGDAARDAPPLAVDAAYGAPPPRDAALDATDTDASDAEAPDGGGIALYGAPAP